MATKAQSQELQRQARLRRLAGQAVLLGCANVKVVGTGPNAFVRGAKPGTTYLSRITSEWVIRYATPQQLEEMARL